LISSRTPLVSVIVPTHNSSATLEVCLRSIDLQTYRHKEIIVVDNFSTDQTLKIAQGHGARVFQIRSLRSAARNYGATKANGYFLIFVDSDVELEPRVFEESVRASLNSGADAVSVSGTREGEGFWAKCRQIEYLTYIGDPLIEWPIFMKKEAFEKVGGFDENLEAAEDWDLHARMIEANYKIINIKARTKHHDGRITLKKILRKRYYYGKTLIRYLRKHPRRARVQYLPIRLNFIRNWRVLVHQPRYGCGMLFMKILEYVVAGISMIAHA